MSFKNITFILHKPQLSENIGACARALKNFNFNNLSIVNPKPTFPNDKIIATSVGAKDVIKKAKVYLSGPGFGREIAIRRICSRSGFNVILICDVTSIPHNGCRSPKRRRVLISYDLEFSLLYRTIFLYSGKVQQKYVLFFALC